MRNIAVLATSAFTGLFICGISDETVVIRTGTCSDNGIVYGEPITLDLEYQEREYNDDLDSEPGFSYQDWFYFISDFMVTEQQE